jgi:hypothetical protein
VNGGCILKGEGLLKVLQVRDAAFRAIRACNFLGHLAHTQDEDGRCQSRWLEPKAWRCGLSQTVQGQAGLLQPPSSSRGRRGGRRGRLLVHIDKWPRYEAPLELAYVLDNSGVYNVSVADGGGVGGDVAVGGRC